MKKEDSGEALNQNDDLSEKESQDPAGYAVCNIYEFKEFLENHLQKVKRKQPSAAIFTHSTPDPDAIGCLMGLRYLLENAYNLSVKCFYDGAISHPQNISIVQLLDPHLVPASEYDPGEFDLNVLVDVTPEGKVGSADKNVNFDIVIDHHKDVPVFDGLLIHYHTGSCCTIIYNLIEQHDLIFARENDLDAKVATGMLVGVLTDTNFCLSPDTIDPDWYASQNLAKCRNEEILDEIIRYERPMSWIKLKADAISEALNHGVEDGLSVVGLGLLKGEQRDVLADIAEEMISWKTVTTAVVFAIFDGNRIEGALRTRLRSTPLADVAKNLGGKRPHGSGGARGTKGGYVKYLGSMAIDSDEPNELKEEMWAAIKKREIAKIYKAINK